MTAAVPERMETRQGRRGVAIAGAPVRRRTHVGLRIAVAGETWRSPLATDAERASNGGWCPVISVLV